VVSAGGARTAIFDSLLAERGLARRALVSVSSFSAAPMLLERSDMVGVFTRRIAAVFAEGYALQTRPLPAKLPALRHTMLWHARYERDPMHAWLRRQLRESCASI
jgi:DNA-binding transcriptional LysR family regulator